MTRESYFRRVRFYPTTSAFGRCRGGPPKEVITENVVKDVRPGVIVIMHFNRPACAWNSAEALRDIVPALRAQGYQFARLQDFPLRGR